MSIGEQHITSIIIADAVREQRLKKGQIAAALIKSTEVMIVSSRISCLVGPAFGTALSSTANCFPQIKDNRLHPEQR